MVKAPVGPLKQVALLWVPLAQEWKSQICLPLRVAMAAANIRVVMEKLTDSKPRSDFHNGAECKPMVQRNYPVNGD
jgi:hypothetical protein